MRTTRLWIAAAALALAGVAAAEEKAGATYHLGTNPKHTSVSFVSEAEIENIYGMTHDCSGTVWIDFEKGKGKADIAVPVAGMDTGIPLRNEHMRSEKWLDAATYPDIKFASEGFDVTVKNADKGLYEAAVKGKLTVHGVTKDFAAAAKIVKLPEALARKMSTQGDWVRVIAAFDVKLADFQVTIPDGPVQGKVSPVWTVKFDAYATTSPPEKK